MELRKFSGLLLYLLFLGLSLHGQYKGKPYIVNYNAREYLTDNQNWSIDVNEQGIVYIGNNKGLLEFDGSNWDLYSIPGDLVIRSVSAKNDSIIYTGAYEEFGYWKKDDKGKMHYHSLIDLIKEDYIHNDEIWRIVQHDQKIYFQSFSNIFIFDGKNIEILHPTSTIVLLLKARDRLFVHMIRKGLYEIKDDSLVFVRGSGMLSDDEIKVMLPYQENRFLIGASQSGMFVYDGQNLTPWNKPLNKTIKQSEVNAGLVVDNLLVIGTVVNGIFIFDQQGNLKNHLHTGNYLQNNTVLALAADKMNNIWAGLDRGLEYLTLGNNLDFYVKPSNSIGSVYDAEMYDEKLWVGTNQGLFQYRYDSAQGFIQPKMIEGSQGQVWDVQRINGTLFCGHTNGTYKIINEELKQISHINGGFELKKIQKNGEEYLIQSTYSFLVIYKKTTQGWQYSHGIKGFIEPIPDFEIDHQGYIWAAHNNKGIFRIGLNNSMDSATSIQYYGKNKGFPFETKIRVAKIENRIVFSTAEQLFTYDDLKDTILPYNKLNPKIGHFKTARKIIQAGNHHYWFIADNQTGLFNIHNNLIEEVLYYDLSKLNMYMTFKLPNIVHLNDSLYLICLDRGFAILNKDRMKHEKNKVDILLRKVLAKPEKNNAQFLPLDPEEQTEVAYALRNLEFTYSSPNHFLSSEFRYKLNGLDTTWSKWQDLSKKSYIRLPAGKYTFMVQARNLYGQMSATLEYPFMIKSPWYASRTAWILYITAFIGGLLTFRLIFKKRLKLHRKKIEEQEKEKREQEKIRQEQKYMQLKNEKLQNEISHKSIQLANYTMSIIRKNELLMNMKDEIIRQKQELGQRFPDYYYRKLLKMLDQEISSEEDWKRFEFHFDQAHSNFFKRIKQQYPDLTQADLKLCAYLRLNLTSKEIAPLLNISIRSVEVRRYRLRKRLNLDREENLVEFLLEF